MAGELQGRTVRVEDLARARFSILMASDHLSTRVCVKILSVAECHESRIMAIT